MKIYVLIFIIIALSILAPGCKAKDAHDFESKNYVGASDGTNMWVANYKEGTVTKLRELDGIKIGTYKVGKHPIGVASDGVNIWVANASDGTITKLRISDGTNLGTYDMERCPVVGLKFNNAYYLDMKLKP